MHLFEDQSKVSGRFQWYAVNYGPSVYTNPHSNYSNSIRPLNYKPYTTGQYIVYLTAQLGWHSVRTWSENWEIHENGLFWCAFLFQWINSGVRWASRSNASFKIRNFEILRCVQLECNLNDTLPKLVKQKAISQKALIVFGCLMAQIKAFSLMDYFECFSLCWIILLKVLIAVNQ